MTRHIKKEKGVTCSLIVALRDLARVHVRVCEQLPEQDDDDDDDDSYPIIVIVAVDEG